MRGMSGRALTVPSLALLVISGVAGQTPLEDIRGNYRRMSEAYVRKDTGRFLAHFAPVVVSQAGSGGRVAKSQFAANLNNLFQQAERIQMLYQIRSYQEGSDTVIVTVRSSRIFLLKLDGQRSVREGTTDIRHTWTRRNGRWEISEIFRLGPPGYGRQANSSYYWI